MVDYAFTAIRALAFFAAAGAIKIIRRLVDQEITDMRFRMRMSKCRVGLFLFIMFALSIVQPLTVRIVVPRFVANWEVYRYASFGHLGELLFLSVMLLGWYTPESQA